MEKFCWKLLFWQIFFKKFRMCFFKVKHYFGHISGMLGPIDVKLKGSTLVGYWAQYVTLTFELTHDLDLGCFKVKFRNSSISGIVGLIDVKWKGSELIWYWADFMTLPFWPRPWPWRWSFKVRFWTSFISGREWPIDTEWKGSGPSIRYHDVDQCDHGGWADVPDSHRGDFRRRRAVDTSSSVFTTASILSRLDGPTDTAWSPMYFTLPHALWFFYTTKHQRMAHAGTW